MASKAIISTLSTADIKAEIKRIEAESKKAPKRKTKSTKDIDDNLDILTKKKQKKEDNVIKVHSEGVVDEDDAYHHVGMRVHKVLADLGLGNLALSDIELMDKTDIDNMLDEHVKEEEATSIEFDIDRDAFLEKYKVEAYQTKDIEITVDILKQHTWSVEVSDFQGIAIGASPLTIWETIIDLNAGVFNTNTTTVFTEVRKVIVTRQMSKPDITILPENIGMVQGEVVVANTELSQAEDFSHSTVTAWKQSMSTFPLTFNTMHTMAKQRYDIKAEGAIPRSYEDNRTVADYLKSDMMFTELADLTDAAFQNKLSLQYVGYITEIVRDDIKVDLIKHITPHAKDIDKEPPKAAVEIKEFTNSVEETEHDFTVFGFTKEDDVYTREYPSTVLGPLSPHNRLHMYDMAMFPTCLLPLDANGQIHGVAADVGNATNYFGTIEQPGHSTYKLAVEVVYHSVATDTFAEMFGFSSNHKPVVTHAALLDVEWHPKLTDDALIHTKRKKDISPEYMAKLLRIANHHTVSGDDTYHKINRFHAHVHNDIAMTYNTSDFFDMLLTAYGNIHAMSTKNPFKALATRLLHTKNVAHRNMIRETYERHGQEAPLIPLMTRKSRPAKTNIKCIFIHERGVVEYNLQPKTPAREIIYFARKYARDPLGKADLQYQIGQDGQLFDVSDFTIGDISNGIQEPIYFSFKQTRKRTTACHQTRTHM